MPPPAPNKYLRCYGTVDVEGGVTALYPVQPGRVVEVCVKENEYIANPKAKPLLRLDPTFAQQRLDEAKADLAASQLQLSQTQKELVEQHNLKVKQQEQAIEADKKKIEAGEKGIDRLRELLAIKSISEKELAVAQAKLGEVRAALRADELKLEELNLDKPKLAEDRAAKEVEARKARVAQAQYALDECTVWAPEPGTVLQLLVNPGSVVSSQPTQPALYFLPDKPLIVRAEVEQEFTNRIALNDGVTVQEENSASKTWDGTVKDIAGWYTQKRSAEGDALRISSEIHTLECIISLKDGKGDPLKLKPGQHELRVGQRVAREDREGLTITHLASRERQPPEEPSVPDNSSGRSRSRLA